MDTSSVNNDKKARKAASHLFTCMVEMLVPAIKTLFRNAGIVLPIQQANDPYYLMLELKHLVEDIEQNVGGNVLRNLNLHFLIKRLSPTELKKIINIAIKGRNAVCHVNVELILINWKDYINSWETLTNLINSNLTSQNRAIVKETSRKINCVLGVTIYTTTSRKRKEAECSSQIAEKMDSSKKMRTMKQSI